MTSQTPKKLIKLLNDNFINYKDFSKDDIVKILKYSSDKYYNDNTVISDDVFDLLKDYLREIDPDNLFLDEVGAPIKGKKKKVVLPYEMGSLNKHKVDKWIKKYDGPYVISDKLDGASVQLYKNDDGELFLYSRGDGKEGQDISHLLKYIKISDMTIDKLPIGTSVRGELIITKKNFNELLKMDPSKKNGRNTIAGLINSKTVDKEIAKKADFVCYSVLWPKYKQKKQIKLLKKWGFTVVEWKLVDSLDEEFLKNYLIKRKEKSEYEIDGIVCADNSNIYDETGGYPDHMFAFKILLDGQSVKAIVKSVIWKISRHGYIKPKIEIYPVELMGTTITFATAFNAKYIVDNCIGKGTTIELVKGGEVIPYINKVLTKSKSGKPDLPNFDGYDWNETGVDFVVTNTDDFETVNTQILIHFFKKIGVKWLSEGIINNLVENGYDSIVKILKANFDDLYEIDGLGEKIINKIYSEIDRAFAECSLAEFMAGSQIFGKGLGERKINEILKVYPNILTIDKTNDELFYLINKIPGYSDKTTSLFVDNLDKFKKFYNKLGEIKNLKRFENIKTQAKGKIFENMTIVMTGFRDGDLEKFIEDNGGKNGSSVSKKTSLVMYKDGTSDLTTSKILQAKKLNIAIVSKNQFINMYKDYL
jgi:NAD-dependent DNA ligase